MSRPLIALTSYHEPASWGVWRDVPSALLPWAYVRQITEAGGAPVLLPPAAVAVPDVLDRVDGLLLSGGPDVDPARYGAERDPATQPARVERDRSELTALARAERRGIPVLAICRGMQVLAVSRGGSLHQHLPSHAPRVPGRYETTQVRISPGTRLAKALGESAALSCAHHQGVDAPGTGLTATAWAEDGTIEAVEDLNHPFLLGVQSHPEETPDAAALFAAFVHAATHGVAVRSRSGSR